MTISVQAQELNNQSLASFGSLFKTLTAPTVASITGAHRSEFVGPWWLRQIAGPGLAPLGLGGWWGKLFDDQGEGMNIVHRRGQLATIMPVKLVETNSLIDGRMGLAVTYPRDSRFPWPWVVDELRRIDERCLLGMTLVIKRPLNRIGLPFLLHAREIPDGL
jgi:hypothetical protein